MAQLKGKGAMSGVNLLAKTFNNNRTKDGKTQFFDIQVDHRDKQGQGQTNLHLVSSKTTGPDGKSRFNNGAPYSAGQFEKIAEAAGPNVEPIANADGEEVGKVYAIKADLMPSSRGNGLVLNSESLGQSDFKVDDKTMTGQFQSMHAAREQLKSQPSREAEAETQTAEAVKNEAVVEEPAVG